MIRIGPVRWKLIFTVALLTAVVGNFVEVAGAQAKQTACIAVMAPTLEGVPGNAVDAANGVRDLIVSYLQGPSIKAMALEAKLPSQAAEEAKQKGCTSLLIASVRRKSSNHNFLKALGQAAGSSSYSLPYGGSSVGSTIARTGTTAGLQTASSMAQTTKTKDELSLEYKLQSPDGEVEFGPKTERRTAKTDGEDLLTPTVTRAAEAIVTGIAPKSSSPAPQAKKH